VRDGPAVVSNGESSNAANMSLGNIDAAWYKTCSS
jgi:hypothetical protein